MTRYKTNASATRIPLLETDEDLARDQLNYFRSENIIPPSEHLATDEEHLAALSLSRDAPTPTSNMLAPIKERPVRRRTRARKPPKSSPSPAFPPVPVIDPADRSLFRRRAAGDSQPTDASSTDASEPPIGIDGVPTIEDMSPQQIRDAIAEIHGTMDEDTIAFFRQRGRVKSFYEDGSENTAVFDAGDSYQSDERIGSENSTTDKRKAPISKETPAQSPRLVNIVEANKSSVVENGKKHLVTEELIVPTEEPSNTTSTEREKRQWMSDTTQEGPSDEQLNSLLQSAIDNLGEAARPRYNLSGIQLSAHQIATLPTHLALHHHGTEPNNAGYTLPDILLLTRSTVLSQRVLSLQIITAVISQNRDAVLQPLIDSGALALVFAPFPSESGFDSSLTNQDAYLHCVEVLVAPYSTLAEDEMRQGLYFASNFYSQLVHESTVPLLEVLATSDCIKTLVRIAMDNASCDGGLPLALRSLNVIRMLVSRSSQACQEVYAKEWTVTMLQTLSLGPNMLNPATAMLSCDILSQTVIRIGWNGQDAILSLKKHVLSEDFLAKVGVHLSWLHRGSPSALDRSHLQAAKGAMRMYRAALSFECGISSLSTVISSVCILAQGDDESSTEAYLALEAYVHALYTKATNKSDERDEDPTAITEEFVKDQLSGLVPIALSAATVFASNREGDISRKKAAAGQFVGTVLAIAPIPLDKAVAARILNESTMASRKIASTAIDDHSSLAHAQTIASVSHACARILSKVKLDPSYVRIEVDALRQGAIAELKYCQQFPGRLPWRPIANSCAEWIGALSKVDHSKTSVECAVALVPYLSEPQVVIDLLARSILRAQVLQTLNGSISIEVAQKCSRDLLPLSLTKVSCIANGEVVGNRRKCAKGPDPDVVLVTIEDLLDLWIEEETVLESLFCVVTTLFNNNLVDNVQLLYILLCSLRSVHDQSEDLVKFAFTVGSMVAASGHHLVQDRTETVLSTNSTLGNPRFCDSLLSLADHLVSRGPIGEACEPASKIPDYLASIVLSIMFEHTVDTSLRVALWTKTILECGGGMLYQNARLFSSQLEAREDPVEMQTVYIAARLDGLLNGERCPSLLQEILALRTGHGEQ